MLLLLDLWPLNRSALGWRRLLLEKLPLLALSALSSGITLLAQRSGGALSHGLGFDARVAHAAVATVGYLGKFFWPLELAVFYPHPGAPALWHAAACALLLVVISGLVVWRARAQPYLLVGWLWFLVTLLPVIGLVQVGAQAMADRYTYVPTIGLGVMLAWGVPDLARRLGVGRALLTGAALLPLLALPLQTRVQVRTWASDQHLFAHALAVTDENFVALERVGTLRLEEGRVEEAVAHLHEAVRIEPGYDLARANLGRALLVQRRPRAALPHLREAVRLLPTDAPTRFQLAVGLEALGMSGEAIAAYREVLRLDPDQPLARRRLQALESGSARDAERTVPTGTGAP